MCVKIAGDGFSGVGRDLGARLVTSGNDTLRNRET
jgi:hypothetical protein